jgi:hypothetical protein
VWCGVVWCDLSLAHTGAELDRWDGDLSAADPRLAAAQARADGVVAPPPRAPTPPI